MSDEWGTDPDLYHELVRASGIKPEMDYAASPHYTLVSNGFNKNHNALSRQWLKNGFLNPPNSRLRDFITWATAQWKRNKIDLIILCPAHVIASAYFKPLWKTLDNYDMIGKSIYPIYKRPRFRSLDGRSTDVWASRNPYIAVFLYGNTFEHDV